MVEDMKLRRLLPPVRGRKRKPTAVAMFRDASRHRDAGRLDDALNLVLAALSEEPTSLMGHVLAGNLYVAIREIGPARTEFEHVLAVDPHQPRALLGLARIALEENDALACRILLERALDRYPDFPEAEALLEVVQSPAPATVPFPIPPPPLVLPRRARQLLLVACDGTLQRSAPSDGDPDRTAQHVHRVNRLVAAILERAELGHLRGAMIGGVEENTLMRCDEHASLAVTFPADLPHEAGWNEVDRLWRLVGAREDAEAQHS